MSQSVASEGLPVGSTSFVGSALTDEWEPGSPLKGNDSIRAEIAEAAQQRRRSEASRIFVHKCDAEVQCSMPSLQDYESTAAVHDRVLEFYHLVQLWMEDRTFPFVEEWVGAIPDDDADRYERTAEEKERALITGLKAQVVEIVNADHLDEETRLSQLSAISRQQKMLFLRRVQRLKDLAETQASQRRQLFKEMNSNAIETESCTVPEAGNDALCASVDALLGKLFVFLRAASERERLPRPEALLWSGTRQTQMLLGLVPPKNMKSGNETAMASTDPSASINPNETPVFDCINLPEDLDQLQELARTGFRFPFISRQEEEMTEQLRRERGESQSTTPRAAALSSRANTGRFRRRESMGSRRRSSGGDSLRDVAEAFREVSNDPSTNTTPRSRPSVSRSNTQPTSGSSTGRKLRKRAQTMVSEPPSSSTTPNATGSLAPHDGRVKRAASVPRGKRHSKRKASRAKSAVDLRGERSSAPPSDGDATDSADEPMSSRAGHSQSTVVEDVEEVESNSGEESPRSHQKHKGEEDDDEQQEDPQDSDSEAGGAALDDDAEDDAERSAQESEDGDEESPKAPVGATTASVSDGSALMTKPLERTASDMIPGLKPKDVVEAKRRGSVADSAGGDSAAGQRAADEAGSGQARASSPNPQRRRSSGGMADAKERGAQRKSESGSRRSSAVFQLEEPTEDAVEVAAARVERASKAAPINYQQTSGEESVTQTTTTAIGEDADLPVSREPIRALSVRKRSSAGGQQKPNEAPSSPTASKRGSVKVAKPLAEKLEAIEASFNSTASPKFPEEVPGSGVGLGVGLPPKPASTPKSQSRKQSTTNVKSPVVKPTPSPSSFPSAAATTNAAALPRIGEPTSEGRRGTGGVRKASRLSTGSVTHHQLVDSGLRLGSPSSEMKKPKRSVSAVVVEIEGGPEDDPDLEGLIVKHQPAAPEQVYVESPRRHTPEPEVELEYTPEAEPLLKSRRAVPMESYSTVEAQERLKGAMANAEQRIADGLMRGRIAAANAFGKPLNNTSQSTALVPVADPAAMRTEGSGMLSPIPRPGERSVQPLVYRPASQESIGLTTVGDRQVAEWTNHTRGYSPLPAKRAESTPLQITDRKKRGIALRAEDRPKSNEPVPQVLEQMGHDYAVVRSGAGAKGYFPLREKQFWTEAYAKTPSRHGPPTASKPTKALPEPSSQVQKKLDAPHTLRAAKDYSFV